MTRLVLLALFAGACHRAPPHPPPPTKNVHGEGIDRQMVALNALYHAPPGNTPCESAWNAFKASLDASQSSNAKPVVLRLSPHDEFVTHCQELSAAAQQCLVPSYLRGHHQECAPLKPSPDLLHEMMELNRDLSTDHS